jgi:hypothetical protein
MSRRKTFAVRNASGRIRQSPQGIELLSPTETRRLIDAAKSGLRDQVWGSVIGRLYANGKLTAAQFGAAKRWSALTADYSVACRSPSSPRTLSFDYIGGRPTDPDTDAGITEAKRHKRATTDYLEGRNALRLAGRGVESAIDNICVADLVPAGLDEFSALKAGLEALATLWTAKRKAGAR